VDNFGVKYVGEEHIQHLKNMLEQHYKLTCDWTGTRYIGITLDWDYNKRQVHLSMPNYVKKSLETVPAYRRQTTAFTLSEHTKLHSTSMQKKIVPW